MYKIQNLTPGNLPIDLENGSIILQQGHSFDIEAYCSRKWIANCAELQYLLAGKHIRVVFDSVVSVPKSAIKSVKTPHVPVTVPISYTPVKSPKLVDLSSIADPDEGEFVVVKADTKVEIPKEEATPVKEEIVVKEEVKEEVPVVDVPEEVENKEENESYKSKSSKKRAKRFSFSKPENKED